MNNRSPMAHGSAHGYLCPCFIIPSKVLDRFSRDRKLSAEERKAFSDAVRFEKEWRKVRAARTKLTLAAKAILPSALAAAPPSPPHVTVFDCRHGTTLPGISVPNPGSSSDATAKRAFVETTAVADFYQKLFGRNSI